MGFDTRDRDKIAQRTKRYPDPSYDYRLDLGKEPADGKFSFLAVGDSGSRGAKELIKGDVGTEMGREPGVSFVLHLGDLVYASGSKEGYKDRFIRPYRKWLLNGEAHDHDDMVFTLPVLPVYGNHDYYDLKDALDGFPLLGDLIGDIIAETQVEIGSGSNNGEVFEQAFVESDPNRVTGGRLPYVTGEHTRIPNRYYWFTHGPCAFLALDSNTLDTPERPHPEEIEERERQLKEARSKARATKARADHNAQLLRNRPGDPKLQHEIFAALTELAEWEKKAANLEKYLGASPEDHDDAQLRWLESVLQRDDVKAKKWKIVFMHHSLYSSESSHTDDPEADGLQANLRRIFAENGVHLVLSGHSHCFEWITRAEPRGDEDAREEELVRKERAICYLVSGGGGRELRRSVLDPANFTDEDVSKDAVTFRNLRRFSDVAESRAYAAIQDDRTDIFNYLRVDVDSDTISIVPVGIARTRGQPAFRAEFIPVQVNTLRGSEILHAEPALRAIEIQDGVGARGIFL